MLTGNSTASKYPFMDRSTMMLSGLGLSLAPERVLDSKLYPRVSKPTLLHINRLDKTRDYIELNVVDDDSSDICKIYFALTTNCPKNIPLYNHCGNSMCVGYAIQDEGLCGCVVGDSLLVHVLKTTPVSEFNDDAFIFSPSVVYLRVTEVVKPGRLMYGDKEVKSVVFSTDAGTIVGSVSAGYTINTEAARTSDPITTVKKIYFTDTEYIGGDGKEHVYIQAGKDSGIRVISAGSGITVGRLSEL